MLISTFVRGSVFFAPEDKFGRIKEGMTKEQILTIIGSDPKDKYTSDPTDNRNIRVDRGPSVGIIRRPDPQIEEAWDWFLDDGRIIVYFNKEGIVILKDLNTEWRSPTMLDKLFAPVHK